MVRLVHITTLPQTAASFLQGQLGWLRQHGMDITIISSPGAQLSAFAEQEGIHWQAVPLQRAISPGRDLAAVRCLAKHLSRIRPHIVHAHTPKAGLVGMLAATWCQVPVRIYHLHGLRFETSQGTRRGILHFAERTTCRLAHRVLCVSNSLRERGLEENLFGSDKCRVLAHGSINGLDVDRFVCGLDRAGLRRAVRQRFGIPTEAPCLGFVGRLVRDKGVVDLHAAWRRLRAEFPALHLLLVGPFETQDPVPPEVRVDFQQDPRVHLTGLDWEPRPYYAAMDVFTLPSHREGLGNVLLEASAMELPVVGCHVTGCVDAVAPDETGRLVPPKDPAALAAAIAQYLQDPQLARAHGQAGRDWVRGRFAPPQIWQAGLEEYGALLRGKGIVAESHPRSRPTRPLSQPAST